MRCKMVLTILFLSIPVWVHASMTSSHFQISTSVMSGGGGTMSSPGFTVNAILGQPTPIPLQGDYPLSADFRLYPGYMYTIPTLSCFGDFNVDGDVDGEDVNTFIIGYPGAFSPEDLIRFASEFGKDDCL